MPKRGPGKTAAAKATAAKVGYEAELSQFASAEGKRGGEFSISDWCGERLKDDKR